LSAASQQQLFCQQLPNSNCFVNSFPTAIVLSAASQQQLFCQQLANSNCFVSSFPTAIVLSAASQQQLSACRQDCLAAACNSRQQVDARIVSTHQQATAVSISSWKRTISSLKSSIRTQRCSLNHRSWKQQSAA
jgi:hypothetical protein